MRFLSAVCRTFSFLNKCPLYFCFNILLSNFLYFDFVNVAIVSPLTPLFEQLVLFSRTHFSFMSFFIAPHYVKKLENANMASGSV